MILTVWTMVVLSASPDAGVAQAPSDAGARPAAEALRAPALATTRIADGDRLMQDRRYREAAFAYQDASNADPDNIEALFKLGNAYAVLGYYDQAIRRWSRVTGGASISCSASASTCRPATRPSACAATCGGCPARRPGPGSPWPSVSPS